MSPSEFHLLGCPSSIASDDRLQPSIYLCLLAAKTLADAMSVVVLVATDYTEHEYVLSAFIYLLILRDCVSEVDDGRSYERR